MKKQWSPAYVEDKLISMIDKKLRKEKKKGQKDE